MNRYLLRKILKQTTDTPFLNDTNVKLHIKTYVPPSPDLSDLTYDTGYCYYQRCVSFTLHMYIHIYIHTYMYKIYIHTNIYICINMRTLDDGRFIGSLIRICMYVCMYVCMYMSMYINKVSASGCGTFCEAKKYEG